MRRPYRLSDLVLADADVLIDFFNGKEPSISDVKALLKSHRLALASITLFELRAGVTGKRRLASIDKLCSLVPVVQLNSGGAKAAAAIYTQLKTQGQLIGISDILVSGLAIANDMSLYSRNVKHFERVPGLKLWRE